MGHYNKPNTSQDFEANFKIKKPLMNETEAYYESSRCLFCYDAPCIQACPTGIDIPLFIKQITSGNLKGSAKTIFESNWLGNACGKICPTGVLCEGACVYNHQDVAPVQIGRLQNYATSKVIKDNDKLFSVASHNGKKIAVIGAGPAGIACACELRILGYDVDIYESKEQASGLTLYGIAAYKITNEEVLDELNYLKDQFGLNFICNHSINSKEQIEELENNYDAIFLGVGIGPTASLSLPGEDADHVIGAVEFIEDLRMKKEQLKIPERVVVIGGGNTAMDAASQSARLGAKQVSLVYRRDRESMGAYGFEYDLTVSAGVDSIFNAQPVAINDHGDRAEVRFIKTRNNDGKLDLEDTEFGIEADLVIKATGQAKQANFLSLIDKLELDSKNRIVVSLETYQCTNPMYFAGGDAVNGGAEVVNAAFEGKTAAHGIDKFLNT